MLFVQYDARMTHDPNVEKSVMEVEDLLEESLGYADPERWRRDPAKSSFNEDAWTAEGRELAKRDQDLKWEIGEWLVKGIPHFGEDHGGGEKIAGHRIPIQDVYAVAGGITGLGRRHLVDLASTAKRCPASVRTDELSWSHHRVLINERPGDTEEQLREKLQEAVAEDLSVAEFKKRIRSGFTPAVTEKSFVVTVPLDVWETLKTLADEEEESVAQYAAVVLATVDEDGSKREMAERSTATRRKDRKRKVGRRVARSYDKLGLQR